jgi:hypothetical protein
VIIINTDTHKRERETNDVYLYICLAYFPYFEKIKVGLWDYITVCVCVPVYPPYRY